MIFVFLSASSLLTARVTSKPFIFGIITSMNTRSGWFSRMNARASSPLRASNTS
jgi:hypothetical protein